jgi:glycosyltransferase involved in cell wall biosynthesis
MGVKEMVTPETGRLVPPGDAAALAEALGWLATLHEPERRMLGQNGRAHLLRSFTLAQQAEALGAAFAACRGR